MAQWRRLALATFPDRARSLGRAFTIYDLLADLRADLEAAYKKPDPTAIDRIWSFVAWCFEPKRNKSVRNAAAVAFYEHLPLFGPARRDMPSRLSTATFRELLPAFRVTLEDAEYDQFVAEFLAAKGEPAPKRRPRRNGAA